VVEVYKVGSIYMTAAELSSAIQNNLNKAAAQKGCKVLSFTVLNEWVVWQGLYNDYYIRYQAIIGSASTSLQPPLWLTIAQVIMVLAVLGILIVVLYIILVARESVQALFNLVPTSLKPVVATLLLVGVGVVAIGGGIALLASVIPRIRKQ
jgi:uncharacterized membrane protein